MLAEDVDGSLLGFLLRHVLFVGQNRFGHLVADGIDGVEGGHGFLEDHGDLVAPDVVHLPFCLFQQILSVQKDFSFHHAAGIFQKLHDGHGGHALTAAGLPDQSYSFAFFYGNIHTIHGGNYAFGGEKLGF